jgi:4-alpha-glucanotransferase
MTTTLPQVPFPRSTGVLLHMTSLPSRHGIGDLGAGARAFVDFLHRAGVHWWQTLPVCPPGPGQSPYSSSSAMAGHSHLIDLDALVADGLLSTEDVRDHPGEPDRVDFDAVWPWKEALLQRAAHAFATDPQGTAALVAFVEDEPWVVDHALFVVGSRQHQAPWWLWQPGLRDRGVAAIEALQRSASVALREAVALQLLFQRQWQSLRTYAASRQVSLMGDLPIYVDHDSADVWRAPHLFELDDEHQPTAVAGVPPDVFSATGQLWGNPLYRWSAHAQQRHGFWVDRLRRQLRLFDAVRIDHFRGFCGYWSVPAGSKDASTGTWRMGPGQALFDDLHAGLSEHAVLPLIAEDLGVITADVDRLRNDNQLPGMKILQFGFGGDANADFLPHRHPQRSVVYTGTHDNDTTVGFYQSADDGIRDHIRRYFGRDGGDVAWDFIRAALSSVADTAIIPMQDLLTLDSGARMNMPGTATGNWSWRVREEAFHDDIAARLYALNALYQRLPTARG